MKRAYELPLTDWISLALNQDTLESALGVIKEGRPLDELKVKVDNRRYIEKILKEEALNQFSDYSRPMLEIILNSIDAKPNGFQGNYVVEVNVKRKKFTSADRGRGMSLDEILRLLIIPFNTEKKGIEEIGRFGVGFLSTFNYCLHNPNDVHILVDTRTGKEGYLVDFYSTSDSVGDLKMRVKPISKGPSGTKVMINSKLQKKKMIVYLREQLKDIPAYITKIFINNKLTNDDSKERWYTSTVELEALGKTLSQQVGFKACKDTRSKILLTSQGIPVKRFDGYYDSTNATVSFPPAVRLVEGRDEFKIDDNYMKCAKAAFKALELYLHDQEKDDEFVQRMINFIPSLMSACSISDIPNLKEICEILLPRKKYALTYDDMENLSPFLGDYIKENAFKSMHHAYSLWSTAYKNKRDLFNDVVHTVCNLPVKDFIEKSRNDASFYPNLRMLADLLETVVVFPSVSLVEAPVGEACMCIDHNIPYDNIYINVKHPDVSGDFSPSKVYSVISDYIALPKIQRIYDIRDKPEKAESKIRDLTQYFNKGRIIKDEQKKPD
ncbi:MAG: ATP-binding protein [Nanoarchaeota archaeon]|nr:ATP-binding protein [Nanoarchaeota archaeon]